MRGALLAMVVVCCSVAASTAAAAGPAAPVAWAVSDPAQTLAGSVHGVSCSWRGLCVAIDGRNALLVSRDPLAGTWGVLSGVARLGALTAVACPSDDL
jgi:hypothetical protein